MTAAYRSSDVDEYYNSPTVTLPAPTGLASGDVLFAEFIGNDGARTLNTLPSDWSLIASATTTSAPSTGFWLCKKVAGGSEPASYDFVFNYDFNGRAAIVAYQSGSDVSVYGTASAADAGSSTPYNVAAGAITVPDDDSKLVFFGAGRFTTTGSAPAFTPPASYTERIDSGASYDPRALTVADITQASAGSSGAVTGTVARTSAGAARTVGVLVAIAPVGGSSQIAASGTAQCAVISQAVLSSAGETINVGNYADVPLTVRDQDGVGLAGLTGTDTSSDTAVATVAQQAATNSSGQADFRITGVAPGSATVTATFDGVVSNPVTVTVVRQASRVLTISPTTAALDTNATQQFTASYDGSENSDVVWSVESGSGTVTTAGLYTSPSTATTAVIRVTLAADASIYNEATVAVTDPGSDDIGLVQSTWSRTRAGRREPLAGYELDYWIISTSDALISSGSGTTNSAGVLQVHVPSSYSGQNVLVVVNNLAADMETAGKIKGQQVVTVQ